MTATRREFLKRTLGSAAFVSLAPVVPNFLLSAVAQGAEQSGADEKVLVVIQLNGGNDGLNTVVPQGDDLYYKARYTLAVPKGQALKIDDYTGFHPSLTGFAELLEAGRLAVVQGVGYPNPDRSHFSSMDVWNTAVREIDQQKLGWLGRWLDATTEVDAQHLPAVHLGGGEQPLSLVAERVRAPSFASIDRFRLAVDDSVRQAVQQAAAAERPGDDLLQFMQRSTLGALSASQRIQEALQRAPSGADYPGTTLAGQLKTVARLIDAEVGARVFYLTLDGFDTHSDQGQAHAGLLSELGGATAAFMKDLQTQGRANDVLVMTFSEFGRRVGENASRGTDHGAAAPMFLAGGTVKPGLIGPHPKLDDLDDGDLKHHTDFRRVYASVVRDWLGGDPVALLGRGFEPLPLFPS